MSWNPFDWFSNNPTPTPAQPAPVVVTPATHVPYVNLRPECLNRELPDDQKDDLASFVETWKENQTKYSTVGLQANVPPMLVAAIHWREASGDFGLYLEQGDKLGTVTYANGDSNDGHTIPSGPNTVCFTDWITAAVWSLNQETAGHRASGISFTETSVNDMLTFAEYYNGTGYMKKGIPSPYTLAWTTCYEKGKYTDDHGFDPDYVDEQLGVLVMLRAIMALQS